MKKTQKVYHVVCGVPAVWGGDVVPGVFFRTHEYQTTDKQVALRVLHEWKDREACTFMVRHWHKDDFEFVKPNGWAT